MTKGVLPGLMLAAWVASASLSAQPPLAPGEVLIERTILPDAHASSFAFGLPGGISFCYDPVRGGLSYAWTGGFIDLTNVRPINKLVKPAALTGTVVYRETGQSPLRRGDPARAPVVEFKGYTLRNAAVELRYTVDGVFVTEEIQANAAKTGLVRRFHFDRAGGDATWFHVVEGKPATMLQKDAAGVITLDVPFAPSAP